VVGAYFPEGIHHIHVAVQTEDLFLCPTNGEFALLLDALGVGEVQGSEACLGEVHQEDIPPFAEVGLTHLDA